LDLAGPSRVGRNRRDAKNFHQLGQMAVAILVDKRRSSAHGGFGLRGVIRTMIGRTF
jgi:hypothetical protein